MKNKILFISLAVVLALSVGLIGCAGDDDEEPEIKTLKIGALTWFEFPIGKFLIDELDAIVPVFNDKGGLVIDGVTYHIEMIIEDSGMDPAIALAAVEKLIHQDEVDFILGDETTDAWLATTEAAEMLVVATSPNPLLFDPAYEYVFQASSLHTNPPSVFGWFTETYPELTTVGAMFPDSTGGHAEAGMLQQLCDLYGLTLLEVLYYPPTPDFVDFSSYAEALATANPDIYTTCAGGPVQDALSMKALKDTGWDGQIFLYVALSPEQIEMVLGDLSIVEGMIAVTVDTEVDPPPPIAQELIDAYTDFHGKEWDYPVVLHINEFYCLMEALKQAQSLDADDVAAVLAGGMEFGTPQGEAMMIARPDFGIPTRTIDALYAAHLIQIQEGEAVTIKQISLAEAFAYVQATFP